MLLVTESVPSVRTTICSGGRLSTIVERNVNFPEIGPTVAARTPSNVLSSICFTSSMPGKQAENLLMSIKKFHALFGGHIEIDLAVKNHWLSNPQKKFSADLM